MCYKVAVSVNLQLNLHACRKSGNVMVAKAADIQPTLICPADLPVQGECSCQLCQCCPQSSHTAGQQAPAQCFWRTLRPQKACLLRDFPAASGLPDAAASAQAWIGCNHRTAFHVLVNLSSFSPSCPEDPLERLPRGSDGMAVRCWAPVN